MSRTLMLIVMKVKYDDPISIVEDVPSTKTGNKVLDPGGRKLSHKIMTWCGTWT